MVIPTRPVARSLTETVPRIVLGWREWAALPELGIRDVKAKIDSGAKTSALHVMDMELYERRGKQRVKFHVHPDVEGQITVEADAPVVEWRDIKDSGGHTTNRPIIKALAQIGPYEKRIELSLTQRPDMGFRMLIGREALRGMFVVDPQLSFVVGERHEVRSLVPLPRPPTA